MRHVAGFKAVVLAFLLAFTAFGQRDLGTIVGTITDPQGGVIANAKVTITEDATGLTYEVTSNSSGEFVRPALKPGTYTVTVEAVGSAALLSGTSL